MPVRDYFFFAPLANAAGRFNELDLGKLLRVEKWSGSRIRKLAQTIEGLPDWEVAFRLESTNCIPERKRFGFVVLSERRIHVPKEWSVENHMSLHRELDEVNKVLDEKLRILRLLKDGNVRAPIQFWYTIEGGEPQMESAVGWQPEISRVTCFVHRAEIRKLSGNIARSKLPLSPKFLQIAFDHLEASYETEKPHVQFLSLMIALESIFNFGPQDLRYRISRGAALLLGRNANDREDRMRSFRKYYDKRSILLHTGKTNDIGELDIYLLRHDVREVIQKVAMLGLSKESLARRIDAAGFDRGVAASI